MHVVVNIECIPRQEVICVLKVGILTYHRSINYGAYLQAYALTKTLTKFGLEIEIIDFNTNKSEEVYRVKNKNPLKRILNKKRANAFKESLSFMPLSKESLISDNIAEFNKFISNKYDVIIVGSDEIWRTDSFRGFPNPYWLNGISGIQKIAYAASSCSDLSKLSAENQQYIREALLDYQAIGVRDQYTFDELSRVLGNNRNLQICCDPTFLTEFSANPEQGKEILAKRFCVNTKKKMIGIMLNDKRLADRIHEKYRNKYELVSVYNIHSGFKNAVTITPFEWIDVISCFELLITNYFHGTCFAIKLNIQFVSIDSRESVIEHGKIYDLLNRNHLLYRLFSTNDNQYIQSALSLCDNYLHDKTEKISFSDVSNNEKKLGVAFLNNWIPLVKNEMNIKEAEKEEII